MTADMKVQANDCEILRKAAVPSSSGFNRYSTAVRSESGRKSGVCRRAKACPNKNKISGAGCGLSEWHWDIYMPFVLRNVISIYFSWYNPE